MANAPVESMKHGGFLWLQDLTVHDPYYIMPVLTCLTLYVTIEIGADGTNIKTMGIMRHVLRVVPFIILPFMIHFPGVSIITEYELHLHAYIYTIGIRINSLNNRITECI